MLIDILLRFGAFANPLSISGAEAALGLLIIISFVNIYKTKDFSIVKKAFFMFYLCMIAVEIISAFTGVNPGVSVKHINDPWVLMYLPVVYVLFRGRDKIGILMYLFIGGSLSSIYGIYEYLNGQPRASGFLTHALTFGNVMAIICITAIGVILYKLYETRAKLFITAISLAVCSVGLLLSGSRGPILALIICTLMLIIYRYRLKGLIGGILIAVLFAGAVYSVPDVNKRFMGTFSNIHDTHSSIGTRLVLWDATISSIMLRPVFGYGSGNFKPVMRERITVPVSSRAHAHNMYLQYAFLHGFIGLTAMLGFFGSLMWEIVRRRRCSDMVKVGIFVLLVFLLEGLTENALGDSEVVMTCLSVIGLILAPGRPAISIKDESTETL